MIVTTKNRPYLEKMFGTNVPKSYLYVINDYINRKIIKKTALPIYVLRGILKSIKEKNFNLTKSNYSNNFFWDTIPILFANNYAQYSIKDSVKRKRKKKS